MAGAVKMGNGLRGRRGPVLALIFNLILIFNFTLGLCLALALPAWADVTIGIIGDQFGVRGRVGTQVFEENLEAAYDAMAQGINALNQAGEMDTVLHVGDLTESTQTIAKRAADFHHATTLLDNLASASTPKWFLTPGDHDVNPLEWVQNSQDRSREMNFQALYAQVNPRVQERLYYSFDLGGYHFVALYSHDQLRCDPRWGNIWMARIGEEQLAWLEEDLRMADTAKGVIVFTHQPLWYNAASWEPVHRLLARYNTRVVIAGHTHYDQIDAFRDGIQYQVVGAVGGAVKQGNAAAGAWWHVTRLTIEDGIPGEPAHLSWQPIPVGPGKKSDFSRRYDMDRVQSLAYALGNASAQLGRVKFYLRDGKLVGEDGEDAARIFLSAMGNPVDVPVDVRIRVKNTDQFLLAFGAFEPDHCLEPPGPFQARLRPGANIASSNASTVKMACAKYSPDFSHCQAYFPFWEGRITPAPGRVPKVGEGVILTLEIRYRPRGGGETMVLSQDLALPILPIPNP